MPPTPVSAAEPTQSGESSKTAPDQHSYLPQAGSIFSPINAVASQDQFGNSDSLFQLHRARKFLFLPPLSTAPTARARAGLPPAARRPPPPSRELRAPAARPPKIPAAAPRAAREVRKSGSVCTDV